MMRLPNMPDEVYFKSVQVQQLKDDFMGVVHTLLEQDSWLVKVKAHENSISSALKVHVTSLFGPATRRAFFVDTDYNKHLRNDKECKIETDFFLNRYPQCGCHSCEMIPDWETMEKKSFRPDLIVHHRGDDAWNLIAVEVKKRKVCPFDLAKLRALTLPKTQGGSYCYKLGVFLYFEKLLPKYVWLIDGKII